MQLEQLRQMPKYYKPLIKKSFPYEIIPPHKMIICEDHYLLNVRYKIKLGGNMFKVKHGIYKLFDDGTILPAIVPENYWHYAY